MKVGFARENEISEVLWFMLQKPFECEYCYDDVINLIVEIFKSWVSGGLLEIFSWIEKKQFEASMKSSSLKIITKL